MFVKIFLIILLTFFCRLSHQIPVNDTSEPSFTDAYNDCGHVARCFGLPDNCITNQTCALLLTVTPQSGGADFQLIWARDNSSALNWAGAALSSDQLMGNDSVTECIVWENKTVAARQGLTYGGDEGYGVNTVDPVQGVNNETGTNIDGTVICSWSRVADTIIKTVDFNIKDNPFYVFLAMGPMNFTTDTLMHHKNISMSSDAVYLGQPIAPSNATTTTTTSAITNSTEGNSTSPVTTTRLPTTSQEATTAKSTGNRIFNPTQYFVGLICIYGVIALEK